MSDTATADPIDNADAVMAPATAATPRTPTPSAATPTPSQVVDALARDAQALDAAEPLRQGLVAWHRRGWWARPLSPRDIAGIGLVRLAFGAAADAGPLFAPQALVPGVRAKALAAFASRHGFDEAPGPADWPVRELGPPEGTDAAAVRWRYLMTASYPGARSGVALRALIGRVPPGGRMPVAGRRALSWPRVAASGAAFLAVLAGVWWGWAAWRSPAGPALALPPPAASAPAQAPKGALPAAPAGVAPVVVSTTAQVDPAQETAATSALALPASAAASGLPASGAEARNVMAAPSGAASAPAAPPSGVAVAPIPAATLPSAARPRAPGNTTGLAIPALPQLAAMAAAQRAETATAQVGPSEPSAAPRASARYALVTPAQSDLAALQALRRRLRQALGREGEHLQVEVLPAPGGHALTLWPLDRADDATRLMQTLGQAGVSMRVVEF